MNKLKIILNDPKLQIIIGFILLYSSVTEIIHDLQSMDTSMIGAHHGVAFFALVHILKALPELYEGFDHIDKK